MKNLVKERFIAFSIHLCVSFLLLVILGIFIRLVWYPGFLFEVDGGWQGIQLIAGVDLIIGPLLTFIVFNKAKKSLSRDLTLIGFLQFLCIVGGMWVVGYSRPLVVAYYDEQFSTVSRLTFENSSVSYTEISEWVSWLGPTWVSLELPASASKRGSMLAAWNFLGEDIATNTKLYQPYKKNLVSLILGGAAWQDSEYLKKFSYTARFYSGEVIVDTRSGKIIDVLSKQ